LDLVGEMGQEVNGDRHVQDGKGPGGLLKDGPEAEPVGGGRRVSFFCAESGRGEHGFQQVLMIQLGRKRNDVNWKRVVVLGGDEAR